MADVASSGTLIASALETVGYYYQSYILDAIIGADAPSGIQLDTPISTIAAFVYIIAAAGALGSFVLTQHHKFALWFFLGPTAFYFVLAYRVESDGANWSFGDESRDEILKEGVVRNTLGVYGSGEIPKPRVSWFFDGFNVMISDASKNLVNLIKSGRLQTDLRFITRQQLYGAMSSSVINDETFSELLHVAMLGDCQQVYHAAANINDRTLSIRDQEIARRRITEPLQIKLTTSAKQYVANLKVDYPDLWNLMAVPQILSEPSPAAPQVQIAIDDLLERMEAQRREHQDDPERSQKVAQAMKDLQDVTFDCGQIWNFVYVGLHRHALQIVNGMVDKTEKMGINSKILLSDWREAAGYRGNQALREDQAETEATQKMMIYRALAKQLFHNEAVIGSAGTMMAKFARRGEEYRSLNVKGENELTAVERLKNENIQWQERSRLVYTAASIPYYQGILLYILGLSYPFFCFLLLIPNRHSSFIMFFGLWFWVKTWDVGYAVVMLLDEIFFTIFTGGIAATYQEKGTSPAFSEEIHVAIAAMRAADPTFNLSTYYNVIAVAINAIPLVTSYLTIGTLKGGAGLVSEGIKNYGEAFARATWKTSSQYGVGGYRLETLDSKLSDAADYMENDTGGRAGLSQGLHQEKAGSQHYTQRSPGARNVWSGYGESVGDLEAKSKQWGALTGSFDGIAGNLQARLISNADSLFGSAFSNRRRITQANNQRDTFEKNSDEMGSLFSKLGGITREQYKDHLNRLAIWAAIDSMTSGKSLEAMKHSRIYDVFELPYMDFETDGNRVEFDIALKDDQRYWDFTGEVLNTLLGVGSPLADGPGNRKLNKLGSGTNLAMSGAALTVGVGAAYAFSTPNNHDMKRWSYSGGEGDLLTINNPSRNPKLYPQLEASHSAVGESARDRLESLILEAKARGMSASEIAEAEELINGFNGSEFLYDSAATKIARALSRTTQHEEP